MARLLQALLLCALILGALPSLAQAATPPPTTYPYTFGNFVWWTDADLRQELHKRVHGLGDRMAPNSPEELRMRDALRKLLRKKGISAEVQTIEPSALPGGFARAAGAPEPAIVFRVVAPPEIVVESVSGPSLPPEAEPELRNLDRTLSGKEYAADTFWWREQRVAHLFVNQGFLDAKVTFTPGAPHGNALKFLVPLTVTVAPGPQFHVAELTFDGGPQLEGRNLARLVPLHRGDPANPAAFARLEASAKAFYQSKGYADVAVEDAPELDRAHALASFHFRVLPGPQYKLSALHIEGLRPAQSGEAREILGLHPGDPYNEGALRELYKKIKSAPTLVGQTFGYTVKRDKASASVDLTLDFHPEK